MEFISKNRLLILITFLLSAALSTWAAIIDPIINMDATLYLSAAQEFSNGKPENAFLLYKWPFYSALIACIHSISGASLQNSAYILNIILHASASIGFLACVSALGGNKRTLLIAALIILLFPSINKYRPFIIRDAGFITFYLWAIYHLINGLNQQQLRSYIYAGLCCVVAMLFRIEAVAPLIIIPIFLQFLRSTNPLWRTAWLLLTILASTALFSGLTVWLFGESAAQGSSSLWGFLSGAMAHATEHLQFKVDIIRKQVLNALSEKFAPMILIISVLLMVIYEPLRRLAFVYGFLAWHAIKNQLVLQDRTLRWTFYALFLIQIGLTAIFTIINMYLVSRHTLALTLTILLAAPFSLNYFYSQWQANRQLKKHDTQHQQSSKIRWLFPTSIAVLLLLGIDSLDLKTNKHSIINAGKWVSDNIDSKHSLYSNNGLLLHYAARKPAYFRLQYNWQEAEFLMSTNQIFDFDYAVLEIKQGDKKGEAFISKNLQSKPILRSSLLRQRELLIYDLRQGSPSKAFDQKYFKIIPTSAN